MHRPSLSTAAPAPQRPPHTVPTQVGGRPRLTLQYEDHHFLHRAHLILREALVLAGVVHLQEGVEGGTCCSGEQGEADSGAQTQRTGARPV